MTIRPPLDDHDLIAAEGTDSLIDSVRNRTGPR